MGEPTPGPLAPWQRLLAAVLTSAMLAFTLLQAMLGVARNQLGDTLLGVGLFLTLLPWLRMPEVYFMRLRQALARGALSDPAGRLLRNLAIAGLALMLLALGGRLLGGALP